MRVGWKLGSGNSVVLECLKKKTATKYYIGPEKKFGMGKLYTTMRGTPS